MYVCEVLLLWDIWVRKKWDIGYINWGKLKGYMGN